MFILSLVILALGYLSILSYIVLSMTGHDPTFLYIYAALACAVISLLISIVDFLCRAHLQKDKTLFAVAGGLVLCFLCYITPGFVYDVPRSRYDRALEKLRGLLPAIQSYYQSYGRLPEDLSGITVKKERVDPYHSDHGEVLWILKNPNSGVLLSVGPDGIVNATLDGEYIQYDPTNGIASNGDIIRTLRVGD